MIVKGGFGPDSYQ